MCGEEGYKYTTFRRALGRRKENNKQVWATSHIKFKYNARGICFSKEDMCCFF